MIIDFAEAGLISARERQGLLWRSDEFEGYWEVATTLHTRPGEVLTWEQSTEGQKLTALVRLAPWEMPDEEKPHRFFVEPDEALS